MRRGTTQSLTFTFNSDLSQANIIALYYTFMQKGIVLFEKTLNDVTISTNQIIVPLTQEDTLKISANHGELVQDKVLVQARIKINNNVFATNIVEIEPEAILKDGVI